MDVLQPVAYVIIRSHIALLVIGMLLWIVERGTGYVHFYKIVLRKRQDESEIKATSFFYGFIYFSFMLTMLWVELELGHIQWQDFSFSIWFYAVFVLDLLLCKLYYDIHMKRLKQKRAK